MSIYICHSHVSEATIFRFNEPSLNKRFLRDEPELIKIMIQVLYALKVNPAKTYRCSIEAYGMIKPFICQCHSHVSDATLSVKTTTVNTNNDKGLIRKIILKCI